MKNHQLLALAAVALSAGAFAQDQIGTVGNVIGLVTMSDATSVTTVLPGMPIANGASFVTSSTGTVTLRLKDNCDITLKPNQTVTVSSDKNCAALVAAVTPLPAGTAVAAGTGAGAGAGGVAGAGAGGGFSGAGTFLPLVGAAAVAAIVVNNRNAPNRPISGQ